jgi:single-strand binding protein|nr:MAG TPA: Single strand binding protein [Caudoviricetes sp.]
MNTIQLEGNLARDIEINFTKSGMAVARGSVACNRRVKDGNEWKDVADFVPFVAFDALAEGMNEWTKGTRVWVVGRFSTTKYEKNGETRYSSNVVATGAGTAIFPFKKKDGNNSGFNGLGTEVDEEIPF